LLLNPKFNQKTQRLVKPNLVVAIDNSNSIKKLQQHKQARHFLEQLKQSGLSQKFNIQYYRFGKNISLSDTLNFSDTQTNISNVFSSLGEVYKNTLSPTIIVTDGNQTFGNDYVVTAQQYKQPIYPVILGDSVLKTDLKITKIQCNKYAFFKNSFPVEITLSYVGQKTVNQKVIIYEDKRIVYQKTIHFSPKNNTQVLAFTLKAHRVGKLNYTATITPITTEKNKQNNTQKFSVTIIDERTKVLLISAITHPDLGAFKKAIETNKQRKVTIAKPTDKVVINDYQMVILYQPDANFKTVFKQLKQLHKNYLVVTGLHTDWTFLNQVSTAYTQKSSSQKQDYLARINTGFSLFQYPNLNFESFPPLQEYYGDLQLKKQANILLYQQIESVSTKKPLIAFFEEGNKREGIWIGEGVWKWRAKSFVNTHSFENFDAFIGKTIQYLASNTKKQRLVVTASHQYHLGEASLSAQYFDKNYQFNANANLKAVVTNTQTQQKTAYDFSNSNTGYTLNLNNLPAGTYQYTVSVQGKKLAKKGSFEVLNFNVESQFINPNLTKLKQIATHKSYFVNNMQQLINNLQANEQYKPIQKEEIIQKSLINWKYLLAILLALLAIEWFMRKYNGLL